MASRGRLAGLLIAAAMLSTAAPVGGQRGTPSPPRQTLMHDGIQRTYVVRTPEHGASRSEPLPLVLVLHGGGGNATNAETMTGFTDQARQEGFIVVYPEGTRRVYVTGLSNGGMMTHRLGIELSGRIAAIAPVIAAVFGDEKSPRHPVAAFMINGMLDQSVPPEGGAPGGRFTGAWDGTPTRPALEQASFWARANGCAATPDKTETGRSVVWRHRCEGVPPVALYLVKDNGHAWPGGKPGTARGDTPTTGLDATGLIWEFFKAHTR